MALRPINDLELKLNWVKTQLWLGTTKRILIPYSKNLWRIINFQIAKILNSLAEKNILKMWSRGKADLGHTGFAEKTK